MLTYKMNIHKMLCLSLKQELNYLNSLISIISRGNQSDELKSWILPTKAYQYVTHLITAGKYEEASYQDYLELTIDRLYIFMRLIIYYINNPVEASSDLNQLIIQPTSISIGLCAKNIWEIVKSVSEKHKMMSTKMTSNVLNKNTCTQTDTTTLSKCDSCFSAMECMKNLLNLFNDKEWKNRKCV
ncbi:uncharacterized protein LOC143190796 [Rhynchophorus ferrugineus]|uniref:uncharacterized protein LOC143190796 n=1 Tax=Rhynchophorus ferrugineus TaxID=354439 RepID=UPI003FCEACAF